MESKENQGAMSADAIIRKAFTRHMVQHVQVPKEDKRDRVDLFISEATDQIDQQLSALTAQTDELRKENERLKSSHQVKYPVPGEQYSHYKGGLYEVIGVSKHSETQEELVTYRSLPHGSLHSRPLKMWDEYIEGIGQRFTPYLTLAFLQQQADKLADALKKITNHNCSWQRDAGDWSDAYSELTSIATSALTEYEAQKGGKG